MYNLENVHLKIKKSHYPVFYTGENISLYNTNLKTELALTDITFKEVFSLDFYKKNPLAFYEVFNNLYILIQRSKPNAVHLLLSKLSFPIITESIDGLHKATGNNYVIELQGNVSMLKCPNCSYSIQTPAAFKHLMKDEEIKNTIYCPICSNLLKPNLILFGENMINYGIALNEIEKADLLVVIGSSHKLWPANTLIFKAMKQQTEIINLNLN